MAVRTPCPVCGKSIGAENLARHLHAVHPREATPAMVSSAAKGAGRKRGTRRVRKRIPRGTIRTLAVILLLIAVAALALATLRPDPNRPVTEMCVTHEALNQDWHFHVNLTIRANSVRQDIPANIGIYTGCMRPVHTHAAGGVIHIEGPPGRYFTLGDFFTVWNKPFSSTRVLEFEVDGTHVMDFLVQTPPSPDFVQSYEFENLRLLNNMKILIDYR